MLSSDNYYLWKERLFGVFFRKLDPRSENFHPDSVIIESKNNSEKIDELLNIKDMAIEMLQEYKNAIEAMNENEKKKWDKIYWDNYHYLKKFGACVPELTEKLIDGLNEE